MFYVVVFILVEPCTVDQSYYPLARIPYFDDIFLFELFAGAESSDFCQILKSILHSHIHVYACILLFGATYLF